MFLVAFVASVDGAVYCCGRRFCCRKIEVVTVEILGVAFVAGVDGAVYCCGRRFCCRKIGVVTVEILG